MSDSFYSVNLQLLSWSFVAVPFGPALFVVPHSLCFLPHQRAWPTKAIFCFTVLYVDANQPVIHVGSFNE